MKRILSFLFILIFVISIFGGVSSTRITDVYAKKDTSTSWPASPSIFAESGVLIDASTGTVLYEKKAYQKMYPASITKIMTALLTIENCDMDETIVFSEEAVNSLVYGDANFACQPGEEMSVKDCLYILMLHSANEVATALGEHISGSTEKFAELMNSRAKEAGAKNTHFTNANGLHDEDHYVTAYDMAMITKAAAQYDVFNEIVNTTQYTVSKNNMRKDPETAYQRHKMVWPTSEFYYDGIIGGKTGYTDQSGTTLVTYAKRDGMTLIAVVLKSNSANVYNDTTALLDYGFNNFSLVNASDNDSRFLQEATSTLKSPFCSTNDSIFINKDATVILPKGVNFSELTASVEFKSSNDSFGTITYSFGEKTVGSAKLHYTSTTNNKTKTDANSGSQETSQSNDSESSFKLPGFLLPILIVVVVLIVIFILVNNHRKKLNRIRAMKRQRRR